MFTASITLVLGWVRYTHAVYPVSAIHGHWKLSQWAICFLVNLVSEYTAEGSPSSLVLSPILSKLLLMRMQASSISGMALS